MFSPRENWFVVCESLTRYSGPWPNVFRPRTEFLFSSLDKSICCRLSPDGPVCCSFSFRVNTDQTWNSHSIQFSRHCAQIHTNPLPHLIVPIGVLQIHWIYTANNPRSVEVYLEDMSGQSDPRGSTFSAAEVTDIIINSVDY